MLTCHKIDFRQKLKKAEVNIKKNIFNLFQSLIMMFWAQAKISQQYSQHNFKRITIQFLELIINLKNNIIEMSNKGGQPYNKWSIHEDQALLKLINQNGCKKWNIISNLIKQKAGILNRSGKQCRQRYLNNLKQDNKMFVWTEDEDRKLFELFARFGTKWCEIVKHFPNNCDSFIKNRFYSLTRKSIRKMCKFCCTKTTSLNIYGIKPITIAVILSQGQIEHHVQSTLLKISENQQKQQQQHHHIYYKTLSQLIKFFIFKNNGKNQNQPSPKIVEQALIKIMDIDMELSSPRDKYKNKQEQSLSMIQDQNYQDANPFKKKTITIQKKGNERAYKRPQNEVKKLFTIGNNKDRNIKDTANQHKQAAFNSVQSYFFLQSFKDIYKQNLQSMQVPEKIMHEYNQEYYSPENSLLQKLNEQTDNPLIFKIHR